MDTVNWAGVMGNPEPRRSVMDQKMQREFGNGVSEAYIGSGVGVVGPGDMGRRSVMDQMMQREYNPYYRTTQQENYCSGSKVTMPMSSSNPSRPNWIVDNPYNPMSGSVSYQPL